MIPIYQDTYYTTTADTFTYSISDGEKTIFNGKAYRFPDGSDAKININHICQNHLNSELPLSVWDNNSGSVNLADAVKTFTLYNSAGTALATYEYINDWSYTATASTLSNPVNGRYAVGQYVFTSTVNNHNVRVQYNKSGNLCGEYALYYCNLKSGYDSFLLEGKVVEKKNITTFSYDKNINNNTKNRNTNRYQSNIELNWEVNTGWLDDDESQNVYDNLLTSNNVYLHKLSTGEIFPVSIMDTSVTNKQFKNERMLINYKINLKSDVKRIRK